MLPQQSDDKLDLKIEIMMLLISTYFTSAKKSIDGFFSRNVWLDVNDRLTAFIKLLENKNFVWYKKEATDEKVGDIDSLAISGDQQILPALVNIIEKLD